jgi:indolepyruvate ferredoxin oxidoreductase
MATLATRPSTSDRTPALEDRYLLAEGRVFLSGVQALVRVLLDQQRADRRAGLRTATLVSGYPGSPLAGFAGEVDRLGPIAAEHELALRPAVNEELAATAVWGSQLTGSLPGPRFDGVLGVWYGKSPGVDRAADAIRHGNFVGTDPRGGVLAICGDDPACKSSTIPGASEGLLAALHVPVLAPGSVQEVLDLGRHAIACSRASGLWAALKVVTAVADAAGTAEVGVGRVTPVLPLLEWEGGPYVHRPSAHLLAPRSLELERTLTGVRLELARRYARMNGLNPITHDAPGARLGIVAAGTVYHDLLQALHDLGLGEGAGVRIIKVGMLYPLEEQSLRTFAAGLDEVLVVEEKGPFLERLVKEALYGMPSAPRIVGARDERGVPLVPAGGVLGADAVARAVGARVLGFHDEPSVRARLEQLDAIAMRPAVPVAAQRTPFFCSGCPHSTGTAADDDVTVGAGIGCHTMVLLNPAGRGQVTGITQMGGEGAQWIGAAPFIAPRHFVQNLGDGTFHHSGSLAIRAAVAAKLDVTYKLLYNDTVAMTGGQHVEGQMAVAAVAHSLHAEGVARIVITTDDPSRYDGVALPAKVEVRGRARLLATQRELAQVPGVTVLIHDQACAAELRRARKRGKAPEPPKQVLISERVCEGCGDCGQKSGCLSVEPVETEFGRKTRIHQASCNKDYSCLEGDCPSFLTIIPVAAKARTAPEHPPVPLPEPVACVSADDLRLRLVGVGGTGVVTINQVLGMASLLDGLHASGLDQTGLSQKAGPVVSDLHLTTTAAEGSVTPSSATVDVLLAFDMLGAVAPATQRVVEHARTIAIVSTSVMPTGQMVIDPGAAAADVEHLRIQIDASTSAMHNVYVDAEAISQALFADSLQANVLLLGAAWQQGAIPLSRAALHDALRLNAASVERNIAAFEWGRAAVAAPAAVETLLRGDRTTEPVPVPALVDRVTTDDGELRDTLAVRVGDLRGFGGERAAERYIDVIARVHALEQERLPGSTAFSEAVARGLHKLTAYKDEYEVARLHVEGVRDLPRGTKVTFHLQPPLLRALGMRRKVGLGRWFLPVLRLLRHGRHLRGSAFDPFGHTHVRRVERQLPGEYLELVDRALETLSPATIDTALEIANLPDIVRGYEDIKLAGVDRFRERAAELLAPRV